MSRFDPATRAKALATRAAKRAAVPQPEYPWAPSADACHTCSGIGILQARHRRVFRWVICPPCRGRGMHGGSTVWDAGPASEWFEVKDEARLAEIAARVRKLAPPVGDESTDSTTTRRERALRCAG